MSSKSKNEEQTFTVWFKQTKYYTVQVTEDEYMDLMEDYFTTVHPTPKTTWYKRAKEHFKRLCSRKRVMMVDWNPHPPNHFNSEELKDMDREHALTENILPLITNNYTLLAEQVEE